MVVFRMEKFMTEVIKKTFGLVLLLSTNEPFNLCV